MGVMDAIAQRLAEGAAVVLDGGMGTELEARGVPMDDDAWSAVANLEHADVVERVHEEFIRAGAEVVIANTFAAAPLALEAAGLADRAQEINRRAVEAAQRARERAADGPVAIAGSMSGLGPGARARIDEADADALLDGYRRQAHALAEAGVDLIATEMVQSPRWHGLAVRAATETGLPVWLGVSARRAAGDGRLAMLNYPELDFEEALAALCEQPVAAVAVMHTALDDVDAALDATGRRWDGTLGAYPHHGDYRPPHWVFADIAPEDFAARAAAWVQRGVQLIGGCCGIGPAHIRALRERV